MPRRMGAPTISSSTLPQRQDAEMRSCVMSCRLRCARSLISLRRRRAGLRGDAAIMLDAAMAGEVEHRRLAEDGRIEVAGMDNELVRLGSPLGDDLAAGRDDQGSAHQGMPVLDAGLRHRDHPGRVLIGTGLKRQAVMEEALLEAFGA